MSERDFAISVIRKLHEAGHAALWAGGCVRDELLGLEPDDYDVATDARPEDVARLFRRTIGVGASFGVMEILGPRDQPDLRVQVASFRSDGAYIDGRHPESVRYSSAEEDAQRRDFTINGLFFDPISHQLTDYVGGQADLNARLLRAIGVPHERFREDKLRLMRGVRMAARFDLAIEPATLNAIVAMADQITVVSAERIADELRKMLALPARVRAMDLLLEVGLMQVILPELIVFCQGERESEGANNRWHFILDTLRALDGEVSFMLAFACLLHGLLDRESQGAKFPAGRAIQTICRRLKLSMAEQERIEWLVANQNTLFGAPQLPLHRLKNLLAHAGILDLLALQQAVDWAHGRPAEDVEYCRQLLQRWTREELDPPVLVTGNDLKEKGLPRGPLYKNLLEIVRNAQLDGLVSTKAEGLALVDREMNR
ncbi:CCA tRNA nucleotidyltransferase [soil metagenome]